MVDRFYWNRKKRKKKKGLIGDFNTKEAGSLIGLGLGAATATIFLKEAADIMD